MSLSDNADEAGVPQPPPGQYPQQGGGGPPAVKPGVNAFAIASLVLGLIGGTLISFILGIIGLVQIRKRPQRGRGLAIAGIVLSAAWILIIALVVGTGIATKRAVHTADRTVSNRRTNGNGRTNSNGRKNSYGPKNPFSLTVGTCFQSPQAGRAVHGVPDVTVVPCGTLHDAEVFAKFMVTGTSYPGTRALFREAETGCQARTSALDKSLLMTTMTFRFLSPQAGNWAAGQRSITCAVVDRSKDLSYSVLQN